MIFYVSNTFFGNEEVARKRHFKDAYSMNTRIIENWNSLITPEDKVYILGGLGDFDFLLSLNGSKVLIMSEYEADYYLNYVKSLTDNLADDFNQEMFATHMKNIYYLDNVNFKGNLVHKDYAGNLITLTTKFDNLGVGDNFNVFGALGQGERITYNCINADIFVNGMFPISELDVVEAMNYQLLI